MGMESVDLAAARVVIGIGGALVGWVALRLENFGHRLVRVETKLENGILSTLDELKSDHKAMEGRIEAHIDGEEARIINHVDSLRRTRRRA